MASGAAGRVGRVVWLGTLVYTAVFTALSTAAASRPALGQTAGQAAGQATGETGTARDTSAGGRAAVVAGRPPANGAAKGSIVGIVFDSLNGGVLAGAAISVEGFDTQSVTDSAGRFRVDSVPPGKYRIGVFHPLLDSLGLSLASPPLTVSAGATLSLVFSAPSAPTYVRLTCGAITGDSMSGTGPSVVVGRVLDAETDAGVAGVRVALIWSDIQAGQSIGFHRIQRVRDTTTGPDGGFRFCHLPSNLAGVARAVSPTPDSSVVSRPYGTNSRWVSFVVLHVPTADTTAGRGRTASSSSAAPPSAGSVLTGRVMRPDGGGPFAGAHVTVMGSTETTVTGDSGEFALRGLPAGTRTVEVRALGWEEVTAAVELTQRTPSHIVIPLAIKTAVLQAVVVTATLNAGLHRVGFDTRKRMGIGHFLTPDDIEKRSAFEFVDLMAGMPGITRRPGGFGEDDLASTRGSGACIGYVVDGMPYQELTPGDINTYVRPDDIGAIEVYQPSESPVQYAYTPSTMSAGNLGARSRGMTGGAMRAGQTGGRAGGTNCVKIVIWTKARLGL